MRLLKLLVVLTLCLSLSVTVFAHPGKTDSQGGHTDHSTGEYHYHHGYSAHQHYDQDGDGDLDCPYDFYDKAGSDSVVSSELVAESKEKAITKRKIENYVIPIVWCFALYGVILIVDEIKWRLKK